MNSFFTFIFCLLFFSSSGQSSTASAQVSTFILESPQLKSTKKIWLYLPKNYETSKKRYPVIYMHDGQNLFDETTSFAGEWNIDEKLDSLRAELIVVGIETKEKRIEELTPFAHQNHGGGKADSYLDFIVNTLKPEIDSQYRTKTGAKHTMMIGSSLGGLTAFYALLKYPRVFGKAGAFSPAFWFNRNEVVTLLTEKSEFDGKVYFLYGDSEGDPDMEPDLNQIENIVNTKRCSCKKLNKKVKVARGQHNEKLWRDGFVKAYLWLD